jgi:hypothetical protein
MIAELRDKLRVLDIDGKRTFARVSQLRGGCGAGQGVVV